MIGQFASDIYSLSLRYLSDSNDRKLCDFESNPERVKYTDSKNRGFRSFQVAGFVRIGISRIFSQLHSSGLRSVDVAFKVHTTL